MHNNVLLSVLNAVDASIFFVCGLVVLALILDYKKAHGISSFKECISQIWLGAAPAVRPAIGFVFLCIGFILRSLAIVPYLILDGSDKADQIFYAWAPWPHVTATISFAVGIGFIMWPTLNRAVYWIAGKNPITQNELNSLSVILLTLGLLLFGVLGYYIHFSLVYLFSFFL
jgi:hypothetical protein